MKSLTNYYSRNPHLATTLGFRREQDACGQRTPGYKVCAAGANPMSRGYIERYSRSVDKQVGSLRRAVLQDSKTSRVRIGLRPYQVPVFTDRSSGILILHWARQIGKSFVLAAWAVDRLLTRPGRLVTVLSNSRDNGAEFVAKCAEVCRLNGTTFETKDRSQGVRFQNMRMEVRIRAEGKLGRIKVLAANPRTARGFSGDLILDEFAFHEDSAAIWEAAEPILASNKDFMCRIASTGNGKHNLFYRMTQGMTERVKWVKAAEVQSAEWGVRNERRNIEDLAVGHQTSNTEFRSEEGEEVNAKAQRRESAVKALTTKNAEGEGIEQQSNERTKPEDGEQKTEDGFNAKAQSRENAKVENGKEVKPLMNANGEKSVGEQQDETDTSDNAEPKVRDGEILETPDPPSLRSYGEAGVGCYEEEKEDRSDASDLPDSECQGVLVGTGIGRSRAGFAVSRISRTEAHEMGVKIYDANTREEVTPSQARAAALDKRAYDQNYECAFADENLTLLSHALIDAAEREDVGVICEQDWTNPVTELVSGRRNRFKVQGSRFKVRTSGVECWSSCGMRMGGFMWGLMWRGGVICR